MKINMPWARFFKSMSGEAATALPSPSSLQAVATESAIPKIRKLHAYCDGEIGNRFNALITGIVLAERSGLALEVVWPVNGRCSARFGDLFDQAFAVTESDQAGYLADKDGYQFLLTETASESALASRSPLDFSSEAALIDELSTSDKPVFLSTPLIPACLPLDRVLSVVRSLPIKPAVIACAESFIAQHLPGPFYGLQICKSESGSQEVDDEKLFALVESLPAHRFFVCSDDRAVETRFGALSNVAVYPKTASQAKRIPDHWLDATVDSSGKVCRDEPQNSAASVIDAVVDLLILSHSQIVRTSGSSLLAVALLLQASRKPVSEILPTTSVPVPATETSDQTESSEPEVASATPPATPAPYKLELLLFETIRAMGLPVPRGILQVGASYGQEMQYFLQNGIRHGLFIEPLPEPYAYLAGVCRQLPGFIAVQALCTEESGQEHRFHVASNGGMSSSIFKPSNHLQVYDYVKFPETVQMVSNTLDGVVDFVKEYGHAETLACLDTLYMDTQGAELRIMMGGTRTLKQINYIYTEIMRAELYEGQPSFQSVCAWLDVMGFTLNNMYFGAGHAGDAIFIRKSLLNL